MHMDGKLVQRYSRKYYFTTISERIKRYLARIGTVFYTQPVTVCQHSSKRAKLYVLWGYVRTLIGSLTAETSCVFIEASGVSNLFPVISTNFSQLHESCTLLVTVNTGSSKKMDGIWNRYNLKSTRRIYTCGVLKCSEKCKVLDLP